MKLVILSACLMLTACCGIIETGRPGPADDDPAGSDAGLTADGSLEPESDSLTANLPPKQVKIVPIPHPKFQPVESDAGIEPEPDADQPDPDMDQPDPDSGVQPDTMPAADTKATPDTMPAADTAPPLPTETIHCKKTKGGLTVTIYGPLSANLMSAAANPTALQFGSNTLGGWTACYGSSDPRPSLPYTDDLGPYVFSLPAQADQMNFYLVNGQCASQSWFDLETAATPSHWNVTGDCEISGTLIKQK